MVGCPGRILDLLQQKLLRLDQVDMLVLEKSMSFLAEHARTAPAKPFFLLHSTQTVHLPSRFFNASGVEGWVPEACVEETVEEA